MTKQLLTRTFTQETCRRETGFCVFCRLCLSATTWSLVLALVSSLGVENIIYMLNFRGAYRKNIIYIFKFVIAWHRYSSL